MQGDHPRRDNSTSESENQVLLGSGHEQLQGLISCLLLNARSLVNKRFEFKAMLKNREQNVVAVTETFLDPEILNSEFVLDSYNTFRRDRNRHGGGVLLLVHKSVPCRLREDLDSGCELIWVQLSLHKKDILMGVHYRPPGSSLGLYLMNLKGRL